MDPFLAEIRIFAGPFAPRGWAACDGQLLPLAQNTELFSLLETSYGGDGRTTFALPDLRGAAPMHQGEGPGLTERYVGEFGGSPTVTLQGLEIPAHGHAMRASDRSGSGHVPAPGTAFARTTAAAGTDRGATAAPPAALYAAGPPNAQLRSDTLGFTGGGQPHDNMQPFLTLLFIICLQGALPQP